MAPPSRKTGTLLVMHQTRPLFRYIIVVIMTVLQRSHDLANTLGLIMIKIQYCGGIFPSHRKAVRVNLKTTFPVHKSSFCVRILLPLSLLHLLIRFMGDKSAGAPKPLTTQSITYVCMQSKRKREGSLLFLSFSFFKWFHVCSFYQLCNLRCSALQPL